MVLLTVGVSSTLRVLESNRALRQDLVDFSERTSGILALRSGEILINEDLTAMQEVLSTLSRDDANLTEAFYVDDTGKILAHMNPTLEGEISEELRTPPSEVFSQTLEKDGREVIRVKAPILVSGEPFGALCLEYSTGHLVEIRNEIILAAFIEGLILVLLGLAAAGWLGKRISRPLQSLLLDTEAVGQGDLSVRSEIDRQDEIGALSHSFNQMTSNLQKAKDDLEDYSKELEKRVEERTQELQERGIEIARQEAILRGMAQASPQGMLVVDEQQDVILFANTNTLRLMPSLGSADYKDLVGGSFQALLGSWVETKLLGEQIASELKELASHPHQAGEWLLQLPGEKFLRLITLPVQLSDSEAVGRLFLLDDITLQEVAKVEIEIARDKAIDAEQAKSQFLANMSHEIRTPMNGVIGMTDLLLDTPLDPEQQDFAQTIRASGHALLTVINDILDFSKIEAGKLDLDSVDFDLGEIIEGATGLLAKLAHQKKVELACELDSSLPAGVAGDPGRLRQVVTNLVGNAVKFTSQGEVVVSCKCIGETDDGSFRIRVEVRDTGEGISEEAQGRLFKAFSQADISTTRKFGGTGLGLSISKSLVAMMHGDIGVDSQLGEGSCFWFEVVLDKPTGEIPKPKTAHIKSLENKSVLVVDDNATNRLILRNYLHNWGVDPILVDGAAPALEAMRKHRFDLVLSDMQMPETSGLELAQGIKEEFGEDSPPVMILTSMGDRIPRDVMERSGIVECLMKPVFRPRLAGSLMRALAPSKVSLMDLESETESTKETLTPKTKFTGKILLAEDNAINRKLALKLLETLGYKADVAVNGKEAFDAVQADDYGLILMDCQMPEMDGYDATRQIRALGNNKSSIPILALTANAMRGDREKCLAAGMDDYLAKPIDRKELASMLAQYL